MHLRSVGLLIAVVLGVNTAASAAQLLRYYDVGKWTGSNIVDQVGGTIKLTPGAGSPRFMTGPNLTNTDFVAPVYVPSGAGAQSRAHLDFQNVGVLTGSPDSGNLFNNSTSSPLAQGYTMEMYFMVRTGYTVAENTGIGFSQSTSSENQCIRAARGSNTTFMSQTCTATNGGSTFRANDANINVLIPRNQWVHFVKVHDPAASSWAGEVRFYTNGALAGSYATWTGSAASTNNYAARGEGIGNVGTPGREIRGVGYSLFRAYRGVLTDEEIRAKCEEVTAPPRGVLLQAR